MTTLARKQQMSTNHPGTQNLATKLGQRLRALRTERRGSPITQGEIAKHAEISVSFLSMIERGERSASIETLRQIAETLGSSLEELFSGETTPPEYSAAFQDLAAFLRKHRASRREIQQLLAVAKVMFAD